MSRIVIARIRLGNVTNLQIPLNSLGTTVYDRCPTFATYVSTLGRSSAILSTFAGPRQNAFWLYSIYLFTYWTSSASLLKWLVTSKGTFCRPQVKLQ